MNKSRDWRDCTCGYWNEDGTLNEERPEAIKYIHAKECPCIICDNTPNAAKLMWALRHYSPGKNAS